MAKLGSTPCSLIPSSSIANRSARAIYSTLTQYFGLRSFADGSELHRSLNDSICTAGRVQEYVSKWHVGVARLNSARFPMNVKLLILNFVCGLPMAPAFNTIRADMALCISRAGADNMGAFIAMTELALELETVLRSANQAQNPCSAVPQRVNLVPPPAPIVSTPPLPIPVLAPAPLQPSVPVVERAACAALTCCNCGCSGHIAATCFQFGGGMEGRRGEY
jgi:hypothetical protein